MKTDLEIVRRSCEAKAAIQCAWQLKMEEEARLRQALGERSASAAPDVFGLGLQDVPN